MKQLSKGGAAALAMLLAPITTAAQAAPAPVVRAPSIVRATPALWEIRDADTTIYLFGTFHTLDGRTVWFDRKVREAFDSSGELVLETVVPENLAASNAEVTETSPDGKRRLKPFIAQTRQAISQGNAMGMSVENGADAVLRRVAEDNGKTVSGLERFEDQLKTLSSIPAPPPAAAAAAPAAPPAAVTIKDLLGAWTRGDTGAFTTMLAGFEAKSPVAYRMLIADRNARWGQWIANRLDQPGTVFVAVGTGHLAGKDSVQQWLAARGIAAARVS
ncbi:MAG TPA: TraB/GumN family protein [Sphingomicrobium sp.]|nr:TraB/GumN family protein [Sphingomicrobium sp.]